MQEQISEMDALILENIELQRRVNDLTAQLHALNMRDRYALRPGDGLNGRQIVRAQPPEAKAEEG